MDDYEQRTLKLLRFDYANRYKFEIEFHLERDSFATRSLSLKTIEIHLSIDVK